MQTVVWNNEAVDLIDQTRLPHELTVFRASSVADMVDAIKRLVVRGAPAIGVAGAYGVVLAMAEADPSTEPDDFNRLIDQLRTARPTAVNLAVRVDEVLVAAGEGSSSRAGCGPSDQGRRDPGVGRHGGAGR